MDKASTMEGLEADKKGDVDPKKCQEKLTKKKSELKNAKGAKADFEDTYERNVAEIAESGVQKDLNQVFLETVGGRKKGKVPGLGTSANYYYDTSSRGKGDSSTPCTPSIVSQLSQKLEESEQARMAWERECSHRMEAQERELHRLEKERRAERAYVEEMKKTLEMYRQMFSQCSGVSSTPRDDHHDQPPPPGNNCTCAT